MNSLVLIPHVSMCAFEDRIRDEHQMRDEWLIKTHFIWEDLADMWMYLVNEFCGDQGSADIF